jgi:CspA family cold shock protein
MQGKVAWFNFDKAFGFISAEEGQDYFVHHSGIGFGRKGYRTLEKDAEVTFDITEASGRKRAVNVMLASSTPTENGVS